jgi:hypothetical protein
MRSPTHLTFAVILACSGFALQLTARQEQPAPQSAAPNQDLPEQNVPSQNQPAANQPAQPSPSAPPQTANPATQTSAPGEKASAPAKPPVLKHRKHKAVARKNSPTHKKPVAPNQAGDSGKVVVRNGGAKEGSAQLAPAVSPDQAKNQRANTASLLAATDANLKRVAGRQLTPAQQNMINEIRTYVQQAKAADASADTNRAQTLAYKARLLSDELARK